MANKSRTVLTPEFRMSYPNFVKAKEYVEKGKPSGKFQYQGESLFPEDSLAKFSVLREGKLVHVNIRDLLVELAKEAWPDEGSVKEMFAGPLIKGWPLKKGDAIADELAKKGKGGDHYRGQSVMSIKANVSDRALPPALGFAVKGGVTTLSRNSPADMERAKTMFVGGNYAVAEINLVAQVVSGFKYITPYVNSVTYTREGAKFGQAGGALMSRFEGVSGGESDHNPTAGMEDDEIPF